MLYAGVDAHKKYSKVVPPLVILGLADLMFQTNLCHRFTL
jgi:hypothetical protein